MMNIPMTLAVVPEGCDEGDDSAATRVLRLLLDGLPLEMARFYGDARDELSDEDADALARLLYSVLPRT